jgi:K+-transporting ATPase A subunit
MTIDLKWIIFTTIVILLLRKISVSSKEPTGDYGIDIETPIYIILLIAFILIWGGFFWW